MQVHKWVQRTIVWSLVVAAFFYCLRSVGFIGVGVPLVWGIFSIGIIHSGIRSAPPEAWSRHRAGTSIPWRVRFAFFTILLAPAFLTGLYFGISPNPWDGLIVGVASAVLAFPAGGITGGLCNHIFGKPGPDVTGTDN